MEHSKEPSKYHAKIRCARKRAFDNQKEARKHLNRAKGGLRRSNTKDDRFRLSVYKCPICGLWHLGHDRKKAVNRAMRKLKKTNDKAR